MSFEEFFDLTADVYVFFCRYHQVCMHGVDVDARSCQSHRMSVSAQQLARAFISSYKCRTGIECDTFINKQSSCPPGAISTANVRTRQNRSFSISLENTGTPGVGG